MKTHGSALARAEESAERFHSRATCPKCKGRTISIRETSEAHTEFEQHDGEIIYYGYHHHGDIIRLSCRCFHCGHRWAPRNATQITDLRTPARRAKGKR